MAEEVVGLSVCEHGSTISKNCLDSFSSGQLEKGVNLVYCVLLAVVAGVRCSEDEFVVGIFVCHWGRSWTFQTGTVNLSVYNVCWIISFDEPCLEF